MPSTGGAPGLPGAGIHAALANVQLGVPVQTALAVAMPLPVAVGPLNVVGGAVHSEYQGAVAVAASQLGSAVRSR